MGIEKTCGLNGDHGAWPSGRDEVEVGSNHHPVGCGASSWYCNTHAVLNEQSTAMTGGVGASTADPRGKESHFLFLQSYTLDPEVCMCPPHSLALPACPAHSWCSARDFCQIPCLHKARDVGQAVLLPGIPRATNHGCLSALIVFHRATPLGSVCFNQKHSFQ